MTAPFPVPSLPDDSVDIRDFTLKRKRIRFKVDNDVFEAYGVLSAPLVQRLVTAAKQIGSIGDTENAESFAKIVAIFDEILHPDSSPRFKERVMTIGDDGIDVREQLVPILQYLLESYGLRPTVPSSGSSTGSPSGTDGTSLTAGQPQLDSTPQSSPQLAS